MRRTLTLFAIAGFSALAMQPALAQDAEALFKAKACTACHAIDKKMVGPAYQAVAEKYAGQEDAVQTLVDSIKNGSKGKWGQIPMPPNQVTDEEAKVLAEWVLEQG